MTAIKDRNDYWYIKKNPITKVGVFDYLGSQISPECEPNKIYKVLRPAEELLKKETLDSLRLLPLINNHEMLGKDIKTNTEFTPAEKKGVEGVLGEQVSHDEDTIYSDIKIYSEDLKEQIKNGKKELSLGYFCTYDKQEGTYKGQKYDYVQRNIIGNHLALVDRGRMGADVRVYDSKNIPEGEVFAIDSIDITMDKDEDIDWITVNGTHIPIKKGETKKDALERFFKFQEKKEKLFEKYFDVDEIERKIQSGEEEVSSFEKKLYDEFHTKLDELYEEFGIKAKKEETKEENKEENKKENKEGITEPAKEDIYLNVPYSQKDEAKSLGAKWNPVKRKWYIPKGKYNEKFIKWEKAEIQKHFNVKEQKKIDNVTELTEKDKTKIENNKKIFEDREENTNPPTKEASQEKRRISIKKRDGVEIKKDWESEKAIGTDIYYGDDNGKKYRIRIFVPKYILLQNGNVPFDFLTQKIFEARNNNSNKKLEYISGLEDYFGIENNDGNDNKAQDEKTAKETIFTIIDGKIYEIEQKENKANHQEYKKIQGGGKMADKKEKVAIDEDKRELINEIGDMLKDKVSEEDWKTIVGKIEKIAYNGSEAGKRTDESEEEVVEKKEDKKNEPEKPTKDKCGKDKEFVDENVEKEDIKEVKKADIKEVKKAVDEMPEKIMKAIAERDSLGRRVESLVGTFDYSKMTTKEVAKYACDKLDIQAQEGQEVATVDGYLKGVKRNNVSISYNFNINETSDKAFDKFMKGE